MSEASTTVLIDGKPVPLDDCIWLERHHCGCVASAVVALVPGEWAITTAEEALRHFNKTDREYKQAQRAGRTGVPVTPERYFATDWRCAQHAH